MANYVNRKESRYDEKVKTFVEVRSSAQAVSAARSESQRLSVWSPSLVGSFRDREVQGTTARRIEDVVNCFATTQIGSLDFLCQPQFDINYNVYGDLDRVPVFGENTNSIGITVDWRVNPIQLRAIPGTLSNLTFDERLIGIARNGLTARVDVEKATGWSRQTLQGMSDDDMNSLEYGIKVAVGGASKLTRLVKGMLLYLDALDRRPGIDIDVPILAGMSFSGPAVAGAARQPDCSYIFNSAPSFEPHEAVLTCMANRYPPPGIQSHVTIPSDAVTNVMVSKGQLTAGRLNVRLSAQMVMSSVVRYAIDTDCPDDVHPALMIAASLRQNRYFTAGTLPKVASFCDLFAPTIVRTSRNQLRPQMSRELAISLGRLHQMISFATAKDLATAAEMSSSGRIPAQRHILEYVTRYASSIKLMGAQLTNVPIIAGTGELDLIASIDSQSLGDILGTSILEVLWLCNHASTVCENGVFNALKKGCYDLTTAGGSMDVLHEEMREANISVAGFTLPRGKFVVEGANLGSTAHVPRRKRPRVTMPITHTHDCESNIGRTAIHRRQGGFSRRRSDLQVAPVLPIEPTRPPPYEPAALTRSSSISSRGEEVAAADAPSPHHWQRVVEEATLKEVKQTRFTVKDATVMFTSAEAKALASAAELRISDGLVEAAEKIMKLKGGLTMPDGEIMKKYGVAMLREDGYGEDAHMICDILHERNLVAAWWLSSDQQLAEKLGQRGVMAILQEPSSQKLANLLAMQGNTTLERRAMREKREYTGPINESNRRVWAHIANSEAMSDYLSSHGISSGERMFGGVAASRLPAWLARNLDFDTDNLPALASWSRDTSLEAIAGIKGRLPMRPLSVDVLPYYDRDSSMTARDYNSEDSLFLHLAAMPGARWVSQNMVTKLSKEFIVPKELSDLLKAKKYRL